jgi:hypothetical protein
VASSGALQNLSAYLNETLAHLGTTFQGSNEYISETLGVPPSVVYSGLAALVAVPLTMSRYGWSREQISPYSSMSGSGPAVTDEDFSYITSQDLDDPSLGLPETRPRARSRGGRPDPEDDVLLIKNKGVIYPTQFPAYSIGDGKLRVDDVRSRICVTMDLPQRFANRIKLLYKGRQLKDASAPIREYGVKNKSEVMAVLPEGEVAGSTSEEEEEVIVDGTKSRRRKKKKSKKSSDKKDSGSPSQAPPPAATGPMGKLDELRAEFTNKWLPLAREFIAAPPADPKKREEEHRKISESILQQIVLKLDGVETDGNADIRTRRKAQITEANAVMKEMDVALGKS